jgi:hypothetical protein
MNNSSMYALEDAPGKGKGLVAIERIPRGTRILSEPPVITTPVLQQDDESLKSHISQQVASLSEHQRQSFLTLYNLYPYQSIAEQSLGIIRTNGLPIGADGIEGGIFLDACRINHSCDCKVFLGLWPSVESGGIFGGVLGALAEPRRTPA